MTLLSLSHPFHVFTCRGHSDCGVDGALCVCVCVCLCVCVCVCEREREKERGRERERERKRGRYISSGEAFAVAIFGLDPVDPPSPHLPVNQYNCM